MKHVVLTLLLVCFWAAHVQAQLEVCISVENDSISGSDYFFDVYLAASSTSMGNVYLANADFWIDYNAASFSSPTIAKLGTSPGFVTLEPRNTTGLNLLLTRAAYFDNTSVSLVSGALVVNLNGPTPADKSAFLGRVAEVDTTSSTHRLGRFRISGYSGGSAGLTPRLAGVQRTRVFSMDSVSLNNVEATVKTATLPVTYRFLTARALSPTSARLDWQTRYEANADYFRIEKKLGEGAWQPLANVPARGDATGRAYRYIDESTMAPTVYYRLRQVDQDGRFQFSSVVVLYFDEVGNPQLLPNPVKDELRVIVPLIQSQPVRLNVYDVQGRKLASFRWRATPGQEHTLDVGNLPRGTLLYELNVDGTRHRGTLLRLYP